MLFLTYILYQFDKVCMSGFDKVRDSGVSHNRFLSIIIKLIKDVVDLIKDIVDLIRFEELNYFYSQIGFCDFFFSLTWVLCGYFGVSN